MSALKHVGRYVAAIRYPINVMYFIFFVGYLPEEIRRQMIITVSLDRLSVDASFLDHHPLFFGEPQILSFIRVAACKQIIVRYPQVVRVNDRVSLYALASIGCIRILA